MVSIVMIVIPEFQNVGFPEFPGYCHSRNAGMFQEKLPEILENVNAKYSMTSINGRVHLL